MFFTVNLVDRGADTLVRHVDVLRQAVAVTMMMARRTAAATTTTMAVRQAATMMTAPMTTSPMIAATRTMPMMRSMMNR